MNKYNLITQTQNNAEKLFGLMAEKLAKLNVIKNGKKNNFEKNDNRQSISKSRYLEPKKSPQENKKPESKIDFHRNTPVFVDIISPVKNKTSSPTVTEKSTITYSDDFDDENHYSQLETESDLDKF